MVTFYLAIGYIPNWDSNSQTEHTARDWQEACAIAKAVSKIHHKEVRLSKTRGFNNQGTYIVDDPEIWAQKPPVRIIKIK